MPPWSCIIWNPSAAGQSIVIPFATVIWQICLDQPLALFRNVYVNPVPNPIVGEPCVFAGPLTQGIYSMHLQIAAGDRLYANSLPGALFTPANVAIFYDTPISPAS